MSVVRIAPRTAAVGPVDDATWDALRTALDASSHDGAHGALLVSFSPDGDPAAAVQAVLAQRGQDGCFTVTDLSA